MVLTKWSCTLCLTENEDIDEATSEQRNQCESCEEVRPGFVKPAKLIVDSSSKIDGAGAALLFGACPSSGAKPVLFGSNPASASSGAKPVLFGSNPASASSGTAKPVLFGSNHSNGTATNKNPLVNPVNDSTTKPAHNIVQELSKSSSSTTPVRFNPDQDDELLEAVNGSSKVSARLFDEECFDRDGSVKSGKVAVWGSGECDQLPFSEEELGESGVITMTGVDKLNKYDVIDVACGALHTAVLIDDGRVATLGCNDEGALGRVVKAQERYPGVVKYEDGTVLEKATAVSAGTSHTLILLNDGSVVVSGQYKASNGRKISVNGNKHPQRLQLPLPAVSIASGDEHSVATCYNEQKEMVVFVWGVNEFGVMARTINENPTDEDLALSIIPSQLIAPDGCQITGAWAGGVVTVISAKEESTGDRLFFGCGCNGSGEVGVGSDDVVVDNWKEISQLKNLRVKKILLAECSGKALLETGEVYSWGHPEYLGEESTLRSAVKSPKLMSKIPKLRELFCGGRTSIGVTKFTDRITLGWGDSMTGQLMRELDAPVQVPTAIDALNNQVIVRIAIGSQHCIAIVANVPVPTEADPTTKKRVRSTLTYGQEEKEVPTTKKVKAPRRVEESNHEGLTEKRCYPTRERKFVSKF
eukprot:GHVH01003554.1.p1 GENE.GHVH01003554.1~~GHVH01003554.1.p1  ORF type:complete len:643 (+),score=95.65 GHVH01003554.1:725-2653(+)